MKTIQKNVILLHGFWCTKLVMLPMENKFKNENFNTKIFSYNSVIDKPENIKNKLVSLIKKTNDETGEKINLVGHSLGGIISVKTIQSINLEDEVESIVCLGSPLKGSKVIERFDNLKLNEKSIGNKIIGRNFNVLLEPCNKIEGNIPVFQIAGSKSIGLGKVVSKLNEINDGTVGVDETIIDGLEDHKIIETTHSGLIFDNRVFIQTMDFLNRPKRKM